MSGRLDEYEPDGSSTAVPMQSSTYWFPNMANFMPVAFDLKKQSKAKSPITWVMGLFH
jgi:hypothetical protein